MIDGCRVMDGCLSRGSEASDTFTPSRWRNVNVAPCRSDPPCVAHWILMPERLISPLQTWYSSHVLTVDLSCEFVRLTYSGTLLPSSEFPTESVMQKLRSVFLICSWKAAKLILGRYQPQWKTAGGIACFLECTSSNWTPCDMWCFLLH